MLLSLLGVQGIERYAEDASAEEVHGDTSRPGVHINLCKTYRMTSVSALSLRKVNGLTPVFRQLLTDPLQQFVSKRHDRGEHAAHIGEGEDRVEHFTLLLVLFTCMYACGSHGMWVNSQDSEH